MIQGPADEVIASGKLGDDVQKSRPGSAVISRIPSRVPSSVGEGSDQTLVDGDQTRPTNGLSGGLQDVPVPAKDVNKSSEANKYVKKDAMEEKKSEGGVKWSVMSLYLKSMGPWWYWVLAILVFGVQQLGSLAANIWIREWANQYNSESTGPYQLGALPIDYVSNYVSTSYVATGISKISPYFDVRQSSILAQLVPDVDVGYYLAVYAIIGGAGMLVALFRDLCIYPLPIRNDFLLTYISAFLRIFNRVLDHSQKPYASSHEGQIQVLRCHSTWPVDEPFLQRSRGS